MGGTPVFLYSRTPGGVSVYWGCLMVTPPPSEVATKISIRLAWRDLHSPPFRLGGRMGAKAAHRPVAKRRGR